MNPLASVLAALSTFDWISPISATIQNIANGPTHVFLITDSGGHAGRHLIRALRQAGIQNWGHMIVNDTMMISVRKGDAARASAVLDRMGVWMENPVEVGGQGAEPARGPAATSSGNPFDVFGSW